MRTTVVKASNTQTEFVKNEIYEAPSQDISDAAKTDFKTVERNQYEINTLEETGQTSFDSLADKPTSQLVTRLGQLGYIIDPVWGREGEVLQFNLVHLAKGGMKIGSAIRMAAEALGMDRSKVKVLIIKGQVITPYGTYIDKNGIVKQIGKDLTFDELLTDIQYEYDINDPDSWLGDTDQQIQVLYIDELTQEQRNEIGHTSDEILDVDPVRMYLTPEVYKFFFETFSYYLKGQPELLINDQTAPVYLNLYNLIKDISTSVKLGVKELNSESPTFLTDLKKMMEERWNTIFLKDIEEEFSTFGVDKRNQLGLTYEFYIEKLFNDIFEGPIDEAIRNQASSRAEDNKKAQDFIDNFEDRLQFTILDHILRDKLHIDDPHLTDFSLFSSNLKEYLENAEEIKDIYKFFRRSDGNYKILDVFTSSFLSNPLIAENKRVTQNKGVNTYFGYIIEQIFLATRLRNIILNIFKGKFSELSPRLIASIRNPILTKKPLYSSVSYIPSNPNILDMDYANIKFYKQKSSGRHFDGGGILDLLTLAISTHIKSTPYESLVESDAKYGFDLVDKLSKDGVSAMIVDIIQRKLRGDNIDIDRLVRLVAPFAVGDGYSLLDPFGSGITLANVEKMLYSFFTTTTSKLGDKLASHELFLVGLSKKINNELLTNIQYSGLINTEKDLKDAVTHMLSDSQFKNEVIELSTESKLAYFTTQLKTANGFSQLIDFFTVTNFRKLTVQENGQYKLSLGFEYNPHFKTSTPLSVSDFPNGILYSFSLTNIDGMKLLTSDDQLGPLLNRRGSSGLVVGYHPDHLGAIILIPSDRINEISSKGLKSGYRYGGNTYLNIYASDNIGNRLVSRLDFSSSSVSIRTSNSWLRNSYEYELAYEGATIIGFQSNFYAAYTFITGQKYITTLQDTTVLLEHMDPYKDPMHQFISQSTKSKRKTLDAYSPPEFKNFEDLDLDIKNELMEILTAVDQFLEWDIVTEKRVKFKYDSISDLIVSQNFFDEDVSKINELFNEIDPSIDQLSDLTYSKQKLFYHTLNEMFKGYSGTSTLINSYKALFNGLTFGENSPNTAGLHSNTYTQQEFKAVEMLEEISSQLFGYRFFAALKLGAILFYKDGAITKFQPVAFNKWLVQENLNAKRIKAMNTGDMNAYTYDNFKANAKRIIPSYFVFGHKTVFDVIGKGAQIITSHAPQSFISALAKGTYHKPSNPNNVRIDFGKIINVFLNTYEGVIRSKYSERRNLLGKTAMMNGFGKMYETRFSPIIIESLGASSGMNIFQTKQESISKSSFNYALLKTFELLINPSKKLDPTKAFSDVFKGTAQSTSFTIEANTGWETLWENSLGIINLDYATMTLYFGKDLSLIQPSLINTWANLKPESTLRIQQPLSVSELLSSQFKEKIDHLYNNLYQSLSTSYRDGDQLTVEFHQDTSHGIYQNTEEDNSLLGFTLSTETLTKFRDLINNREQNSLSITIQEQAGEIINEEEFNTFVASITLYLVLFNAKALIQENDGSYGLIASQRELLDADYIFQLGVNELSDTGKQILATYQSSWNVNAENRIVWNYGDCWPIHLFNDAKTLIAWFNTHFLSGRGTISELRNIGV